MKPLNAWAIGQNSTTPLLVNLLDKRKPYLLSFAIALVMMLIANYSIAQSGCNTCALGYPDNTHLPQSAIVFNESDVLKAISPGTTTCGLTAYPSTIKMWYNDEHAMTLGVRQVIIKKAGNHRDTTNYPITPYTGTLNNGVCVSNPIFGSLIASGAQSGNDVALPDGNGRPLRPVLYLTDLTVNGATSRIGDWQQGGVGHNPTSICGSWKGAVSFIDSTKTPVVVEVTPDADPAKNNWNLGGGQAPPAGTDNEGYGTLVQWDISTLGLIPGHTYRVLVMVHDGDQNKDGGDAGEMCTTIVIAPALYPDFNVTYVNVPVPGNVSTNDVIPPSGTTYGSTPTLISSPSGSTPSITMNSNGTYSFVSNLVGVYVYKVSVCVPGQSAPCPTTLLTITVLCATCNNNPPVANTDIASTKINTPVILRTLANDRAGNPGGSLNPGSVTVTVAPLHGTTSINPATGDNTYTPAAGYTGMDTLTYTVCDNSTPTALCATALQIITINSTIGNTTLAADDYAFTPINTPVGGNVKPNDTDPEGNAQTVTAQNTTIAGKGTLALASDGSYTFTPFAGFTGPVNFPYTTTDNGLPVATAKATLYILVSPAPSLPDLTPSIFNDGTTLIQNTSRDNVIRIFNIGSGATTAPIIFTIPKMLPAFEITINANETTMNVFGGTPVANADWTIVEQATRYVLTSKAGIVIPAGGFKDIGVKVKAVGIKDSTGNLSVQIIFGTGGGETPFNNNSDNNTYSTN